MQQNEAAEALIQRWLAADAEKQQLVPGTFTVVDKVNLSMQNLFEKDGKRNPTKERVVRHFVYTYYLQHRKQRERICMKTMLPLAT